MNENKKEDLSIPVFTKPISRDGVVDEASVPAPVKAEVPTTPVDTEPGFVAPPQEPIFNEEQIESVHVNSVPNEHVFENSDKVTPGVSGQLSLQQIAEGQTTPPMKGVNPYSNLTDYSTSDSYDAEYYLRAFIGKNYDKFRSGRFNFAFFFFGNLYLFYRKMLVRGVVFTLIFTVIVPLIEYYFNITGLSFTLLFFAELVYAFMINSSYYNYASKKVTNIQFTNMNKSSDEIENICRKKGGRSLLYILLGLLISSVATTILTIILYILGISILFWAMVK